MGTEISTGHSENKFLFISKKGEDVGKKKKERNENY